MSMVLPAINRIKMNIFFLCILFDVLKYFLPDCWMQERCSVFGRKTRWPQILTQLIALFLEYKFNEINMAKVILYGIAG